MAAVTVATGLTITTAEAQGASSAALTPAAQVDIGSFSSRAQAWTSARSAIREAAIVRAEELAAEAKEAESTAEAARLAEEEAERLAAEEAARLATSTTSTTTTVAPTTTAPPPPPTTVAAASAPSGGPTAAQWAALRQCESSGNYSIVSSNGRYRGAYQFSQATWDSVARAVYPHLAGVDPAAASPADQDAMAYALYGMSGSSPWPHCGAHLR